MLREIFLDRSIEYTGGEYNDETFRYRMMLPQSVEPEKTYPAILYLHGAGQRGDDNDQHLVFFPEVMAESGQRTKHPCFVIAPQCREDRQWVDVPWGDARSTPMTEVPSAQLAVALKILDSVVANYPIDERRISLTGLSMGGYGSWEMAIRHPHRFAAAAPICGGGDETHAAVLAHLPINCWHGDADEAVPVTRSREMIEAIRAAGGSPEYHELPGVGHHSWEPAYSAAGGVIPWLLDQVRS